MDADSAKCMKSMNISSMGENYASIICLPLLVGKSIVIGLSHFQKIFLRGSRNGTFNDINTRGVKRSLEMMNPNSQSAIFLILGMEEDRGEKRHQEISLFIHLLLAAGRDNRRKQENRR